MRNWQCRLGVHCDHTMDEDRVKRMTHQGRSNECVVVVQMECCRCERVDFYEHSMYGDVYEWEDIRNEGEDR